MGSVRVLRSTTRYVRNVYAGPQKNEGKKQEKQKNEKQCHTPPGYPGGYDTAFRLPGERERSAVHRRMPCMTWKAFDMTAQQGLLPRGEFLQFNHGAIISTIRVSPRDRAAKAEGGSKNVDKTFGFTEVLNAQD